VEDGQTVVLGGIFETEEREVVNKVPVLGSLPVLGYFFRSTVVVDNQAELLIFVTPRILRDGASLY
jgi:type IV pilus assembly protein PilQ